MNTNMKKSVRLLNKWGIWIPIFDVLEFLRLRMPKIISSPKRVFLLSYNLTMSLTSRSLNKFTHSRPQAPRKAHQPTQNPSWNPNITNMTINPKNKPQWSKNLPNPNPPFPLAPLSPTPSSKTYKFNLTTWTK